MLQKSIPLLPSLNISDTISFYEIKLGFIAINLGNYAILKNENTEIHLFMVTEKTMPAPVSCMILVENIEDLYVSFSARGLVQLLGKLADSPWGYREFSIVDNNKNLIRFAQKR